jgi:hypothetical protein
VEVWGLQFRRNILADSELNKVILQKIQWCRFFRLLTKSEIHQSLWIALFQLKNFAGREELGEFSLAQYFCYFKVTLTLNRKCNQNSSLKLTWCTLLRGHNKNLGFISKMMHVNKLLKMVRGKYHNKFGKRSFLVKWVEPKQ